MEQPLHFLQLAAERYSVRSFSDEPVAQSSVEQILAAGHLAPTACNLQPQRILVIRSAEALDRLKACTKWHFNAPLALLVCYDRDACWNRRHDGRSSGEIDASIVATHMMLEAWSLGVGSTWVMSFDPERIRAEFAVPERFEPVALLPMGYPAPDAAPSPLHTTYKAAEEIVFYDRF